MISDTLSDAVREIRGYLANFPNTYNDVAPVIETLIEHMDAVRAMLDTSDPTSARTSAAVLEAAWPNPNP